MDDFGPTGASARHCPKCDYNLTGLTELRCPECGSAVTSSEIAEYAKRRWRPDRLFRTLILATIPWFIAYLLFDSIHTTTDRIKISFLAFPFLAFPLHLMLTVFAFRALDPKSRRRMKKFGAALTILVWFLILGHIAMSVLTTVRL